MYSIKNITHSIKKWWFPAKLLLVVIGAVSWIYVIPDQYAGSTENGNEVQSAEKTEVILYRSAQCRCCEKWADYLEENGMTVIDNKVNDLAAIKREKGVPETIHACHTAIVDGYVVEGHVPVKDIRRLIKEQPDAIGIAVPGMPAGSPGMEVGYNDSYEVLLFDRQNYSVVAEY